MVKGLAATEPARALHAHRDAVKLIKHFRQGINVGRGGITGRGRSYWPEPDSVRDITNDYARLHRPEHPNRGHFPRSGFGMPLTIKFISVNSAGDPAPQTILPDGAWAGSDRWASPVIVRPIAQRSGQRVGYCPIVAVLWDDPANPSWPLTVAVGRHRDQPVWKSMPTLGGLPAWTPGTPGTMPDFRALDDRDVLNADGTAPTNVAHAFFNYARTYIRQGNST